MRTPFLLLVLAFSFTRTLAQDSYTVDFTDPKSVVNALFYAAKTKDFSVLKNLCDPLGEGDGDSQDICALPTLAQQTNDAKAQEWVNEFVRAFKAGHLEGEVTYTQTGGSKLANVPFKFDQGDKSRDHETMRLIKRNGNWYLLGF